MMLEASVLFLRNLGVSVILKPLLFTVRQTEEGWLVGETQDVILVKS